MLSRFCVNYSRNPVHFGAKEFFDQAQRIQSSTGDPALRNLLRDTLSTRDQITADLARGDAAALSEIHLLLSKIGRPRSISESSLSNPAKSENSGNPVTLNLGHLRIEHLCLARASFWLKLHNWSLRGTGTMAPPSILGMPKCPPRWKRSSGLIDPETAMKLS